LFFNVIPLETHPFHDEAAHLMPSFLLSAASKAVTAVKKNPQPKLATSEQLDVGDVTPVQNSNT
jgi:hypothetical protein